MTSEWYDGIVIPQGKLQRNVVPPTCYNSDERWATLTTLRGLWLNSNLKGYKSALRQQQPLWCTVRAGTDPGCTTCWVGSLFVGWMMIKVHIFYFQRGLFLWCIVVGSTYLLCSLLPAALFLKHSLGKYPKIIPFIHLKIKLIIPLYGSQKFAEMKFSQNHPEKLQSDCCVTNQSAFEDKEAGKTGSYCC